MSFKLFELAFFLWLLYVLINAHPGTLFLLVAGFVLLILFGGRWGCDY